MSHYRAVPHPTRPLPSLPCCPACSELLQELTDRVQTAVALPVRIDIKDCYDATCTELTVTANIGGQAWLLRMLLWPGAAPKAKGGAGHAQALRLCTACGAVPGAWQAAPPIVPLHPPNGADSGGRGRPRVTFDVTQGLSAAGVGVFMADGERARGLESGCGQRLQYLLRRHS